MAAIAENMQEAENKPEKQENKPASQWVLVRFMLPLALATMLNPLNSTMLATALANICHSFARTVGAGGLLITPLYITATIGQPLMGRLADIYSPKKINFLGMILVVIAALIGALAPSFGWLIVSRIILGLGTSAAYPSAIAIVQRKYSEIGQTVPGEVLGIIAVTSLVSTVLGPVFGGFLTEWFGWQGIFLVNIPWVAITLLLLRAIPATPPIKPIDPAVQKQSVLVRVDALGVVFFSLFLISLVLVLTEYHFSIIAILGLVGLLSLLIVWERKKENPFLNVRLFAQKPALSLVYLQTLVTNYILYLMLYSLPGWIEGVKNISPSRTGLMMLPMSVISAASALLASKKKNLILLSIFTVVSMCVACAALFFLNIHTPVYLIIGITLLMGLASGVAPITNQVALTVEAPPNQTGISFGLFRTFGYMGAILSGSQLKTAFHNGASDESFRQLVWLAGGSCLLLCALYLLPFFKGFRYKSSVA